MKGFVYLVLAALISVLLASCGASTPEPVSYTIEMSEFKFTPDTIEAKVGQQVTLNLVNIGALEHEIMFGHDVMMMNSLPSGYQEDMFAHAGIEPEVMMMGDEMDAMAEDEHEEEHEGFMVLLPKKGDKATMTFTVTAEMAGEWEIGCFEQDGVHYTAGMVGKFIVTP